MRWFSKNSISLLLFLFLISANALPQGIKGTVTDEKGDPVPYTTIFLKKTTTGTTTNETGYYQISLEPGKYKVVFRALGFGRKEFDIEVKKGFTEKNVVLKKQVVRLREVRVYSGGEDPAYPIMRKAISMAPYYLRQTGHYESEVYLKGTLVMKKIPRLIANKFEVNGKKIKAGKTYTVESYNKITFDAPDKYKQVVVSVHSTFPGTDDGSPMGYITNSFYNPTIDITISPLAPNAFSHYRFRYLGYINYEDEIVNIIEVIPKRKSQQLFSGKIYIVDNLWNLYSVDVVNEAFFGTYHIKQVYAPVEEHVWLPVNHFIDIDASVFGVKAEFRYTGSVKYKNISLNKDLPIPGSLIKQYALQKEKADTSTIEVPAKKETKSQKKMNELLKKKELSNRDMIKLTRLIEKESRPKDESGSLEVKLSYDFSIKKDSIKRDTSFWNEIRPIPLTNDELKSFKVKDSLIIAKKTEATDTTGTKKRRSKFGKFMNAFLWGERFYACDSACTLHYDGFIGWKQPDFNAVDGWSYKQSGSLLYSIDSVKNIGINPHIRYSFNRQKLYWGALTGFRYADMSRGYLRMDFGQEVKDFNRHYGIDRTLNALSSLLFKESYLKLYGDNYISVSNGIDIANGLRLEAGLGYHNFKRLGNVTKFSIFRGDEEYGPNTPENPGITDANLNDQKEFVAGALLSYTPRYKYRIWKGRKIMVGSRYPTFTFYYERGIRSVFNSVSDYEVITASIDQKKEWGVFSSFSWKVKGGYFTKNDQMHFSEFYHFNTSQIPVMLKNWNNVFVLLDDYRHSTNDKFLEAHVQYTTPYLLLKYLPFLSNRLWLENLYGNYLTQPLFKNYTEIGYGVTQIFFMGSVSVFVGFENGSYSRWGFRAAIQFE